MEPQNLKVEVKDQDGKWIDEQNAKLKNEI